MHPKELAMNMIKQNSNPMVANLFKMANEGKTNEVEQFARNFMKEQGRDFDKEFANFMQQFKR
jgi:hypothetical protein